MRARDFATLIAVVLGTMIASAPAFAGPAQQVPEPVSLSLLAGGIAAIAAVKRMNRKS